MVQLHLTLASVLLAINLSSVLAVPIFDKRDFEELEEREPLIPPPSFMNVYLQDVAKVANAVDKRDLEELEEREPLVPLPTFMKMYLDGVPNVANAVDKREFDDEALFARELEEREDKKRTTKGQNDFHSILRKFWGIPDSTANRAGARVAEPKKKETNMFDWFISALAPKKKTNKSAKKPQSAKTPSRSLKSRDLKSLFSREYDFELESRAVDDVEVVERRGVLEGLLRVFGIVPDHEKKKQSTTEQVQEDAPTIQNGDSADQSQATISKFSQLETQTESQLGDVSKTSLATGKVTSETQTGSQLGDLVHINFETQPGSPLGNIPGINEQSFSGTQIESQNGPASYGQESSKLSEAAARKARKAARKAEKAKLAEQQ